MHLRISFMRQKNMRRVLPALLPIVLFSTYLFGLKVLILLAVVTFAGALTEYLIMYYINRDKARVSEAVFVTCFLFTLTLPPGVPYWGAVLGIVFGILFGKGVFGGFGRNIFNPALVGRCFLYISFPSFMTVNWVFPYVNFPGGLLKYSAADIVTSATPLSSNIENTNLTDIFTGFISGSIGETSAALILLAAVYLVLTKTGSWKIMASTIFSFLILSTVLYLTGAAQTGPIYAVLTGGFLFAAVFMATDPVTAPVKDISKIVYGVLIGALTVVLREFSLFTEGVMFAILIINTFAPLIDMKAKVFLQGRGQKA